MPRRTIAYECYFCGAFKRTKNIARRHELTCFKNPAATNCLKCAHPIRKTLGKYLGEVRWCPVRALKCGRAMSANCRYFKERPERGFVPDILQDKEQQT